MSDQEAFEDTAVGRGEADCFGCYKRGLRKDFRPARLAKPLGLYEDGVTIYFCDKPDCQAWATVLDEMYGVPE